MCACKLVKTKAAGIVYDFCVRLLIRGKEMWCAIKSFLTRCHYSGEIVQGETVFTSPVAIPFRSLFVEANTSWRRSFED